LEREGGQRQEKVFTEAGLTVSAEIEAPANDAVRHAMRMALSEAPKRLL